MAQNVCPQCGAPLDPDATECRYCGEKIAVRQVQQQVYQQPYQQQVQQGFQQMREGFANGVNNAFQQTPMASEIDPSWPVKNKTVAGLLGIFLGGLGIHKFYLGKVGMGILYICLCWTYIPAIVGLVEGITYLVANDRDFQLKHHVRLG